MLKTQPANLLIDTIINRVLFKELEKFCGRVQYTTEDIPSTGKDIHKMFEASVSQGTAFRVFNGANEADNLYLAPNTNLLYRAVHDLDHALAYSAGRGTTKFEDELYLNCLMAQRVYNGALALGYTEQDALACFFIMYHDTVGQVYYYASTGDFCVNQRAHTVHLLGSCLGYKYTKSNQLALARQLMLSCMVECGL